MLKFFSRMERTRNFVLLVFAILMVVSLIFFYAPTRGDVAGNLTRNEETVAKVGSEQVTVADVALQQETMRQNRQPMPSKTMLNQIIGQRLIRIEANRLGLGTSDTEVASFIRQQFKTPDAKPFDQKRYEQNVTDQYGSVQNFEQSVRDQLSAQKLDAFLTSGVTVSEDEVLGDFRRKNTKFDLSYVPVTSADLAQTIKPTDEELKSYFEQNKKNYYISVPQKKIRYIFLNTSKIGEKQSFSDEDLRAEYEKIPPTKNKPACRDSKSFCAFPNLNWNRKFCKKPTKFPCKPKKTAIKCQKKRLPNSLKVTPKTRQAKQTAENSRV